MKRIAGEAVRFPEGYMAEEALGIITVMQSISQNLEKINRSVFANIKQANRHQ